MTDRRISSASTDFTIPTIPGNVTSKEVVIKLANASKYDVYQKDFPTNLPAGYDWINNFGLKLRHADPNSLGKTTATSASDPYAGKVDTYTIELNDVAGKEPVYFDGANVQSFPTRKTSIAGGRAHVTLALGDPPIGWPK